MNICMSITESLCCTPETNTTLLISYTPRWHQWEGTCLPMQGTQEMWFGSLGWGDPWRRAWQPTPVFFPGESHGQRSLVGCCLWGCTESDMTEATQQQQQQHQLIETGRFHAKNYWPVLKKSEWATLNFHPLITPLFPLWMEHIPSSLLYSSQFPMAALMFSSSQLH